MKVISSVDTMFCVLNSGYLVFVKSLLRFKESLFHWKFLSLSAGTLVNCWNILKFELLMITFERSVQWVFLADISCPSALFQVVYLNSIVYKFPYVCLHYKLLFPFQQTFFFSWFQLSESPDWLLNGTFQLESWLNAILATTISSKSCFKKVKYMIFELINYPLYVQVPICICIETSKEFFKLLSCDLRRLCSTMNSRGAFCNHAF